MYTLHNCMAAPSIALLLAEEKDLSRQDADLAREMGFVENAKFEELPEPIGRCMDAFCTKEEKCHSWRDNGTHPDSIVKSACGYFKPSPNMDVGGIGVYIGYLMQLGILAYAYFHTRLMSTWIRWLTYALSLPLGIKRARQKGEQIQEKLDSTHQQAALISSLVEFQKAQGYYAIALEATSIAAMAGHGLMIEASSYRQMRLTIDLLGDIAATGIICLTFGLYILHSQNKRAWYTTILTLLGVIVSLVVWIQSRLPLHNLHKLGEPENILPACGNSNPARYCPGLDKGKKSSTILEGVAVGICLLTTIAIVFRQSKPRVKSVPVPEKAPVSWVYDWRLEISEAVHASMAIGMLVKMSSDGEMNAMQQGVKWTFAQLICVTLWVPMIVEYIYAALRGVHAMQSHRVLGDEKEEE